MFGLILMRTIRILQHNTNERNLGKVDNKMDIHETEFQKMVSQVDSKIDKECANLIATFERYKGDSLKYAAGNTCFLNRSTKFFFFR